MPAFNTIFIKIDFTMYSIIFLHNSLTQTNTTHLNYFNKITNLIFEHKLFIDELI